MDKSTKFRLYLIGAIITLLLSLPAYFLNLSYNPFTCWGVISALLQVLCFFYKAFSSKSTKLNLEEIQEVAAIGIVGIGASIMPILSKVWESFLHSIENQ